MSGGVVGQSSRSVCPFTGIHLWRPTVPALFLFFSLLLPSQLSCQAAPENREFLSVCGLFEPFQSNNEAPQTLKLETIRKVTKHVGAHGERENLLTQKRGSGHPVTSLRFAPSWPVTKISSVSPPAAPL